MKRILPALALATVAWLALRTDDANAAPPCSPQNDFLDLGGVSATYNNQPAVMTTSGRFASDAGVEFYVSQTGDVRALPLDGGACGVGAKQVTLRVTDPWTGQMFTVSLGDAP